MADQLKQGSAFAAAAHVLSYDTLDRYTEGLIDRENERIDWARIIDQSTMMSDGEKVIVGIALALWNGERGTTIADLASVSDEALTLFVEALIALRKLEIRGEN